MARDRQKAKARARRREGQAKPKVTPQHTEGGKRDVEHEADLVVGAPPEDTGRSDTVAENPPPPPEFEGDKKAQAKAKKDAKPAAGSKPAKKQPVAANEPQHGAVITFLRASWAELGRVQWPDRAQTTTLTGIVGGFVIIAGVYLGLIDVIASKLVDFIIF